MIDDFWEVPHHHRFPKLEPLIAGTALKLNVDPRELEVFINSFVQLAGDHVEEVLGFHSHAARRARAALSEFINLKKICTSTSFDLGTGECLDCGERHHPAGEALSD